jgi:dTDP-glucose pyrophosphorylase
MRNFKEHLIATGSIIKDALIRLDILAKDAILFIVDDEERLLGSLTDGDVRRGLIKGITIDHKVDDILQPHPRYLRKGEHDIRKVIDYREGNFRILPVLDKEDRIVNVINFSEIRSYLPVDAVIMAGGRGLRLRPLTDSTPKPLLKVGSEAIIVHNIKRLALYGIDDFWISVNYLGQQIENHVGNGSDMNIQVSYVWEDSPLGTIGAISKITNFRHEYILITNSDLLTNLDYEHFFLEFLKQDADMAVVTIPYQVNVPYAVFETTNGHVINLKEKPTYIYYSNGGIYLVKREVLQHLPENAHFNATDLMEVLIGQKKKVFSYPLNGYWLDIGSKADYEKAQQDIGNIRF